MAFVESLAASLAAAMTAWDHYDSESAQVSLIGIRCRTLLLSFLYDQLQKVIFTFWIILV